MVSLIFSTVARFMLPLMLMFSIFLLLRGHNEPGGGFIGGLVAACGFIVYGLAYDTEGFRRVLLVSPRFLMGLGLLTSGISGLLPLAFDRKSFEGLWGYAPSLGMLELKLGTPLLFDLGVYLVVVGITLTIVLAMMEE